MLSAGIAYISAEGVSSLVQLMYQQALLSVPDFLPALPVFPLSSISDLDCHAIPSFSSLLSQCPGLD